MRSNRLFNSFLTLLLSMIFVLVSVLASYANTPLTIIIDPGHGGRDGGAVGITGLAEKELNLDLSMKLKKYFELAGYTVVMTRETDDDTDTKDGFNKSADIKKREALSQQYENCVFISVHMNSSPSSNDKGFQVFYGVKNEKSKKLAEAVYSSVEKNAVVTRLREVKKAPSTVYLMQNLKVPAILVECGFISNKADEKLLTDDEYRESFAFVLYNGINDYIVSQE